MRTGFTFLTCVGLFVGATGCSQQSTDSSTAKTAEHEDHHDHDHHDHDHDGKSGGIEQPVAPSAAGEKFILSEAPGDPQQVTAAKESIEDQSEVTLVGRIGGSMNPWIEGRAIFTIVDSSLQSCEKIPGDNCPTPWDYCCRTDKVPASSALVKVVDENGEPVKTDARELLGVRELTEVVVEGKAQRDDGGNLTILASKVFVKK